ncbi:putative membrane protein [Robiginitalea myxolifaciens]|uniref:Putative membrane protein n=1 Tax=Robiginitalea myxolifaciens TaxID=400055 RepID=A0A1I6G620_9FLAO|nr:bestrophin family ion channel [Robiginitalea myxolifaciens]SFR37629.1 putative membrane protein [Robiginitalea myxolifaciens]
MYIKRNISFGIILRYAWKNVIFFVFWAGLAFFLFQELGWDFLRIPFQPLSVIGIAVAFYIGFKNSQSYDRFWEGRKIWGGIVNYSRTWTIQVLGLVQDKGEHQQLVYRHLAWINALRVQLRQPTSFTIRENRAVEALFKRHGERNPVCDVTTSFLQPDEIADLEERKNVATHLVKKQALEIDRLLKEDKITEFDKQLMHGVLEELYNLQGKCERIKNTPFPRQYAYFSTVFCWIFVLLIPFGLLDVFHGQVLSLTEEAQLIYRWLLVPFSVLISWIFVTMEKVGSNSEDPFEGRINDVPMTALCRTIEIDLRDMLDEEALPAKVGPKDGILY